MTATPPDPLKPTELQAGTVAGPIVEPVHDHGHPKDNSLDRLLFFSDGVFAIAITLLAIELRPPEPWDGSIGSLWREGWTHLSAFAVSFAVVGVFWNTHRRVFLRIRRFTPGIFVANLALLGGVALMPFATSLIYHGGPREDSLWAYVCLVSLTGVLQAVLWGQAAFVAKAMDPNTRPARHIVAMLGMGTLPGLFCLLTLMVMGRHSVIAVIIGVAVIVAILKGFSRLQRHFGE